MTAATLELQELAKTVRQVHGEMLLDDRFDEPLNFRLKPDFETACWSFSDPKHDIYIGTGLLARAKTGLSEGDLKSYVKRYAHHERAHAMYTERDAARTQSWLAEKKVPFELYNLTEDARIEARYVADSDEGFQFGWLAFETLEARSVAKPGATGASVVSCAYFNCIQSEGAFSDVRSLYPVCWAEAVDDAVLFYVKSVNARDSLGAIEVAKEMLAKYPELSGIQSRCSSLETGQGLQGVKGKKKREKFEADTMSPKEAEALPKGPAPKSDTAAPKGRRSNFSGTNLLSSESQRSLDRGRIDRLAEVLARLNVPKTGGRTATSVPTSRVSVRHMLAGEARWFGPIPDAVPMRPRKLLLVLDCSGSMKGQPLDGGCYLLAALSKLAAAGHLQGSAMLSTTTATGVSRFMTKALPWSVEECERIVEHYSEGLADTLEAHDRLIDDSDLTVVVTDGEIGGKPISHRRYARRKKRVLGAYVRAGRTSLEDVAGAMAEHFEQVVIRDSVERLAEAIALEQI